MYATTKTYSVTCDKARAVVRAFAQFNDKTWLFYVTLLP